MVVSTARQSIFAFETASVSAKACPALIDTHKAKTINRRIIFYDSLESSFSPDPSANSPASQPKRPSWLSLLITQARPGDAVSRITTIEEEDAGGLTAALMSSTMMTSKVAEEEDLYSLQYSKN
ncbi:MULTISPECIES: hypothetical protein [Rhizobium]|uniref:hypothetical protein n=1 Tax=Rhizobium TaxID=379 RepID=UPI001959DF3F|nr:MULTISPECIES: hypothetical protein [Rhizobium]MBM7047618.1 hypothetical protein [Rhizobium lusitanum]